jgi:hypothetical protein
MEKVCTGGEWLVLGLCICPSMGVTNRPVHFQWGAPLVLEGKRGEGLKERAGSYCI